MIKTMKKAGAVGLAALMACTLAAGCGAAKLDGTKTVVTVNGTEIPMGVLSVAVRYQQAEMENLYKMYFGPGMSIWDGKEEGEEETYGQTTIKNVVEQLELGVISKEKAADYGVEVTEEMTTAMKDAAKAFIEANSEEALEAVAATEEQVVQYLELETYRDRVSHEFQEQAEVEVTDDEANQTSFYYTSIALDKEETAAAEDGGEAAGDTAAEETTEEAAGETAVENVAEEATDEASSEEAAEQAKEEAAVEETKDEAAAEETTEDEAKADEAAADETAEEEAKADEAAADETAEEETKADEAAEGEAAEEETPSIPAEEKAQQVLKVFTGNEGADRDTLNTAVKEIDDGLYVYNGHFTTSAADSETSYPEEVIKVLRTLTDGQAAQEVIKTDSSYYIVSLNKVLDEEQTESERSSLESEKKSQAYTDATEEWLDAADIKVNDKVLNTLTLTDSHTFTMITPEAEEEPEVIDGEGEVTEVDADASADANADASADANADASADANADADANAETVEDFDENIITINSSDSAKEETTKAAEEAAGTVEAAAEDAAETVKDAVETAEKEVKEEVETTEKAAKEEVETTEKAAKDAVETAEKEAEETAEAVKDAVEKTSEKSTDNKK